MDLAGVIKFPMTFWLISLICVFFYVTVFPFIGIGLVFFMRKYSLIHVEASGVNSIVYILSGLPSPHSPPQSICLLLI